MVPCSLAILDTRTFLLYTWHNCAEPLSPFPLSFAFPEHIPGERVAPYHTEIKQISHHGREAAMCILTVWLRSLAEANKWLTALEGPVRSPCDFSTLKICAARWGWASQLGSTGSTGCTIPVRSALSLPLSLPTFRAQLLYFSGHRLLFCCTTGAHQGYIHIQKLLCSHFTAWKLNIFFLKEHPPLLTPTTATAVILALHFLQGCFLPESPFSGSILSRQSALFKQRLTFGDLPHDVRKVPWQLR